MSKKLDALDADKAGVSQADLESAFLSLGTLEEERDEAEAELAKALDAKLKADEKAQAAREAVVEALAKRDPIVEEWARADWIVRNADPDQPPPPLRQGPPTIKSARS